MRLERAELMELIGQDVARALQVEDLASGRHTVRDTLRRCARRSEPVVGYWPPGVTIVWGVRSRAGGVQVSGRASR